MSVEVVEKKRVPGAGLGMVLQQTVTFPKPIRVWDPDYKIMDTRKELEILFDASIPERQQSAYESYRVGRNSKQRILILLAVLGYSYPTTAISEATDTARTTTSRLLWELQRDGLIEGAIGKGMYIDEEIWPYRYGPIRENYWMLTDKGAEEAEKLMRYKVKVF